MSIDIIYDRDLRDIPIPEIASVEGWKSVPIEECGEKLIALDGISPRIILQPRYFAQQIPGALPKMYLRESAAAKLVEATTLLPDDVSILVWDAWRPTNVQKNLFDVFCKQLLPLFSKLSSDEIEVMAQTYVSLPSVDPSKPSPHLTGGAVDISLIDNTGNPIPMGTDFDHFGYESATSYYEAITGLSREEIKYKLNRRLLYRVMLWSGFSNYGEEWWHYDYGNQFDAIRTHKKYAIYGGITPDGGDNNVSRN